MICPFLPLFDFSSGFCYVRPDQAGLESYVRDYVMTEEGELRGSSRKKTSSKLLKSWSTVISRCGDSTQDSNHVVWSY